jgi:hypothetical protein
MIDIVVQNWDLVWAAITVAKEYLVTETEIGPALDYFSNIVYAQGMTLLFLIIYPFVQIVDLIQTLILTVLTPFIALINAIFGIGNTFYSMVMLFNGVFPAPIMTMLVMLVSVSIGLAAWSWVKGIEILGFKLG